MRPAPRACADNKSRLLKIRTIHFWKHVPLCSLYSGLQLYHPTPPTPSSTIGNWVSTVAEIEAKHKLSQAHHKSDISTLVNRAKHAKEKTKKEKMPSASSGGWANARRASMKSSDKRSSIFEIANAAVSQQPGYLNVGSTNA